MSDFYICKVYKSENLVLYYDRITKKFVSNRDKATVFTSISKALEVRKNHKILPLETEQYSILVASETQISYHTK